MKRSPLFSAVVVAGAALGCGKEHADAPVVEAPIVPMSAIPPPPEPVSYEPQPEPTMAATPAPVDSSEPPAKRINKGGLTIVSRPSPPASAAPKAKCPPGSELPVPPCFYIR
jgi:hypothetical protein